MQSLDNDCRQKGVRELRTRQGVTKLPLKRSPKWLYHTHVVFLSPIHIKFILNSLLRQIPTRKKRRSLISPHRVYCVSSRMGDTSVSGSTLSNENYCLMDVTPCSFVNIIYESTWPHFSQDSNLRIYPRQNHKSHKAFVVLNNVFNVKW
jgi:hypothetical protein